MDVLTGKLQLWPSQLADRWIRGWPVELQHLGPIGREGQAGLGGGIYNLGNLGRRHLIARAQFASACMHTTKTSP